jgi:hypothetical protein
MLVFGLLMTLVAASTSPVAVCSSWVYSAVRLRSIASDGL